jgi:4-amino-4-deoxy-L-arabinose transferase-like glycosyltransferase
MKTILFIDATINFILGVLLIVFPSGIINWLGVPDSPTSFYPNILGAIFIGITIALIINVTGNKHNNSSGLGFLGAVSINLCGGAMLLLWLIFGDLNLSVNGLIFLWLLVIILILVSTIELIHFSRSKKTPPN